MYLDLIAASPRTPPCTRSTAVCTAHVTASRNLRILSRDHAVHGRDCTLKKSETRTKFHLEWEPSGHWQWAVAPKTRAADLSTALHSDRHFRAVRGETQRCWSTHRFIKIQKPAVLATHVWCIERTLARHGPKQCTRRCGPSSPASIGMGCCSTASKGISLWQNGSGSARKGRVTLVLTCSSSLLASRASQWPDGGASSRASTHRSHGAPVASSAQASVSLPAHKPRPVLLASARLLLKWPRAAGAPPTCAVFSGKVT